MSDVDLDTEKGVFHVRIRCKLGSRHVCPKCGASSPCYDTHQRSWRHLDTCQFRTILVADVPPTQCA